MGLPLMLKLRVINPKSIKASQRNFNNTFYIGKRPGAVLNEGMTHGIFGKVFDNEFDDIKSISKIANYVEDKTKENTIMYRGIISFDEKKALEMGLDNKKNWEELMKNNANLIAEKLGVPYSRLEYIGAVHMEKRHPHMHFTLWDKEQGVKKAYVHKSISNEIRIELTKKIFENDYSKIKELKNEARNILNSETSSFFKSFFEPLKDLTTKNYEKELEKLKKNPDNAYGKILYNRFLPSFIKDFSKDIFEFNEKLPKKGRLDYKFLDPALKVELTAIVKKLIAENQDFKREFEKYVECAIALTEPYAEKPEKLEQAKKNAEDEIIKRLSNSLLKELKALKKSEFQANGKQYAKNSKRTQSIKILNSLFSFLTKISESNEHKTNGKKAELSKQAKKELAIKMETSSGMDWEQ